MHEKTPHPNEGLTSGPQLRQALDQIGEIVLDGLRGESSIAELCRREGVASNLYYRWSKDFLEAGKKRLQGDTVREASSSESRRSAIPL